MVPWLAGEQSSQPGDFLPQSIAIRLSIFPIFTIRPQLFDAKYLLENQSIRADDGFPFLFYQEHRVLLSQIEKAILLQDRSLFSLRLCYFKIDCRAIR